MFRTPNPRNPYHRLHVEREEPELPQRLELRADTSRTVIAENDSEDIAFRWSLNPYRGCTHACSYCYARRTHEYLDLGAGEDFERILTVKYDAAARLAEELAKRSWKGEPVHIAGVTDAWQPVEAKLRITRACLEVLVEHRNPVTIITRSPLIVRDLDLLVKLAALRSVFVQFSIPVVDEPTRRALEPGTRPVAHRLEALSVLAEAGVPVGVSLAPVIPGLTDHTVPAALEQAASAGAAWAFMGLVRLPGSVADVFEARLRHTHPLRADAVLDRIRRARGGVLNRPGFGDRMRGVDASWNLTQQVFAVHRKRLGLASSPPELASPSPFRRPGEAVQLGLF